MNITQATTSIDVAGVRVVFHCAHDDGASSWRIEHDNAHVTVYLHGTPEQMGELCDKIMRAVSDRAIAEVEQANREVNALDDSPYWRRVSGISRWCFVCREWVAEWQTHAHAERADPFRPADWSELAQRERATFPGRITVT